jgi:hypothetical protein
MQFEKAVRKHFRKNCKARMWRRMESCSGLAIRSAVRSEPKRSITNRPQTDYLPHSNCETALAAALAPFHPRPRGFGADLPFVWDEATRRNATVLTRQTDLRELDPLEEVTGLDAFGRRIQTLNLRGLIAAKRAAGREKDLADLVELESLLDPGEPE